MSSSYKHQLQQQKQKLETDLVLTEDSMYKTLFSLDNKISEQHIHCSMLKIQISKSVGTELIELNAKLEEAVQSTIQLMKQRKECKKQYKYDINKIKLTILEIKNEIN